ncbi:MAG TPA: CAAD domain-containing protein [Cyanophyceae cyanobacterium]
MSSEITTTNNDTIEVPAEPLIVEIKSSSEISVNPLPSPEPKTETQEVQWQQFQEKASAIFTYLSTYTNNFFKTYQPLLVALGWLLAAIVMVKLILAVLGAINDIPLLSVTLELIGLGYLVWFVTRYLLSAANRQELSNELKTLKAQVLGL